MKKIKVKFEVSRASGSETFSFADLGVLNEAEWNELLPSEKESRLQEAIDGIEQPAWIVDDFDIVNKQPLTGEIR